MPARLRTPESYGSFVFILKQVQTYQAGVIKRIPVMSLLTLHERSSQEIQHPLCSHEEN